ncbi:MAG: T9SS type A sorting domain-containing protein, partial [FCB group bacterium]|nr:T9SS type A sorting domain-containing protein [FCB group bacterium]
MEIPSIISSQANDDPIYPAYGKFGEGLMALKQLGNAEPVTPLPEKYAIYPNYPNPFNPSTVIRFDLPQASKVKLEVFNILGQRAAVLVDGVKPAGYKQIIWNGFDVASGVYIYRIEATAIDGSE